MQRRFLEAPLALIPVLLLFAVPMPGHQTLKLQSGKSVYVAAIKDSRLLTMCPGKAAIVQPGSPVPDRSQMHVIMLPNGMQFIRIPESYTDEPFRIQDVGTERDNRPARIRYLSQTVDLPVPASYARSGDWSTIERIAPDPDLRLKVEREFLKQKKYRLVDSPEKADVVFLVEGYYVAMGSWSQGSANVTFRDMDAKPNLLQAALAISIPSVAYRRFLGNGESLVKNKTWEGSVICRRLPPQRRMINSVSQAQSFEIVPASLESLVKQFHGKDKQPVNYPPICAATAGILTMQGGFGSNEAPKGEPALKGDVTSLPTGSATLQDNNPSATNHIKVDVSLVTVPVFVANEDGKYLSSLKISDFHVFENNVEQRIDRLISEADPKNVAFMVDASASMGFAFETPQSTISAFAASMGAEDRLMLVAFDDRIRVLSEFTNDSSKVHRAITSLSSAPGTRLYDAIDLVRASLFDAVPGRKAVILFTDGVDTRSRLADSVSTLKGIEEDNLLIYVIQSDTKNDARITRFMDQTVVSPKSKTGWIPWIVPDDGLTQEERYAAADKFLLDLSKGSGGDLYFASTVLHVQDILTHITSELGHEYIICYYPRNVAHDGSYRHIRVTVDIPGVKVRSRLGYRSGMARRQPEPK